MNTYIKQLMIVLVVICATGTALAAQEAQKADSLVSLPYNVYKAQDQMTGSVHSVSVPALQKRVSGDLRGRFTGLVPGMEVIENGGSYFSSISASMGSYTLGGGGYTFNMKGLGGIVAIVDDMLVPYNQLLLDPNQIQSVTILSDVLDKSQFGPMGTDGTIYIRTNEGGYNQPLRIRTSFESGIRVIDRVADWLSGEEYAVYNNMARTAAGYAPLYTDEDIEGFKARDPYSLTTPNVDYRALLFKKMFSSSNLNLNLSAGNNIVKYAFALNGFNSGDHQNGPNRYDYNKINYSGSVSSRIGRYIEAGASFIGFLGVYRGDGTSWHSYNSVPGIAFPLTLSTETDENGDQVTIYGVSKVFGSNPYAERLEGGYVTRKARSGIFQAHLDVDFSWFLPGLKSRTGLQTNSFVLSNIGMTHDYLAYYWDKEQGIGEISSHQGQKATSRSLQNSTVSENLSMYERLSYNKSFKGHTVDLGMTAYLNRAFNSSETDFERYLFFVGNAGWSYHGRYAVEFCAQYTGTDRFAKGSRFGFFPTAGVSWTMSNEEFMKDIRWIDHLKWHAQAGIVPQRSDATGSHYLYEMVYSRASGYTFGPTNLGAATHWFGNTTRTSVNTTTTQYGNPDLTWSSMREIDAGVDLGLSGGFGISFNYFNWERSGSIANTTGAMPDIFGFSDMNAYANYTGTAASGFNVALRYDRRFGDFALHASADASHYGIIYKTIVSDFFAPGNEHLRKTGTSTSGIWGLDCLGRYSSQEQIDANPSYVEKSGLKVGDLMYRDVNGDGTIDANDKMLIGDEAPKFSYEVRFGFEYKGFDFEVVGTGRTGVDLMKNSDFFWNGWGNGNYSAFIKDPMYPNLSYVKSTNNFVSSSYWLERGDWFKIQALDLGYTFRLDRSLKEVRFDIKGENLLTLTKVRYIDPEAPDAGVSSRPLLRVFMAGITLTF
ncbi:MAG: SusC/RagA family TonB-linked outer membrane protein [Bacteroidales bacterium]|nr:SusC/RagA family TonB-linked outer membrane protein [Bacteroidales bacterium]